LLQWVAAGEGDELVERAGGGGHGHGWVESSGGATLCVNGLPRQPEDVSGVGVRNVEGTVQSYGEIPAVDKEFEGQDAQPKMCAQRSPAEHDIVGQSAAAPSFQNRLCQLLDALVDRIAMGNRGADARGGAKASDGVDQMVGEGRHIEVATGCSTVQVVVADRLDDIMDDDQCLFGTGEFVHELS
jgi:hypothetical protein